MKLRPYQQEAYDETLKKFETVDTCLCVLATSLGKTIYASHLINHFRDFGRIMMLAHREELITQARDKINRICHIDSDIEMGENWATLHDVFKSECVVSTIQTQIAGRDGGRMTRFNPDEFSLLIIDECFVAGTMVDGTPIEQIKTGDRIRSYNHYQKCLTVNTVTRLYKRKTDGVVEVKLANGKKFVCTPNHPIFTLRGYISADKLLHKDMVLTIIPRKDEDYGIQFDLQDMQQTILIEGQAADSLLSCVPKQIEFLNCCKDKQEICICQNDKKQSNVKARSQSKSFHYIKGQWVETVLSRWKRKTFDCRTAIIGLCNWLADRSSNTYQTIKDQWLSDLLQSGHRKFRLKNSNRSRWEQPQSACSEIARCKKGGLFEYVRVDSITFHKQGSSNQFEQLCPEGIVYNLEVEGNNNYFVENTLVHNCHHAPSITYRRVIDYYRKNPKLKVLGLTATPDRTDKQAMGQIFSEVAYAYDIRNGIDDGWLVPIEQQSVFVKGLDYSNVKTTAGDLNGKDLAEVLEFEENLHGIADPTVQLTGDKKTLVFAASVAHAERLTEIFNRHKPGSANFVCGTTPREYRREIVKDFAKNNFQYLVNVGVFTEGYDDPSIKVIVLARPTKSRSLYVQMVGRGGRVLTETNIDQYKTVDERREAIFKSEKPYVKVVDFVGNAGRHKLICPADILGGDYSDEVVELAKENAAKKSDETKKPVDVISELQQAEREIAHRAAMREDAESRSKILLRARYSTAKINPFDVLDIDPKKEMSWHKGRQPTQGQKNYLDKCGVNYDGMSFTHCSQVIDTLIKNREQGKPTFKQAKCLRARGLDTNNMTFEEASRKITELVRNRWITPRSWKKDKVAV